MIRDLLKRWAQVEPGRCGSYQNDLNQALMYEVLMSMSIGRSPQWVVIGSFANIESMSGLASLQSALQQAVVAHNFWLRLEYSKSGWKSIVLRDNGGVSSFPCEQDEEPAIALLKSYVSCLESQEARHEGEGL